MKKKPPEPGPATRKVLDPRKRFVKLPDAGDLGPRVCRWCNGPVAPPRRAWCSKECRREGLMRISSSYARARVEGRDKGVCAECGLDARRLERRFRKLWRAAQLGFGFEHSKRMFEKYGFDAAHDDLEHPPPAAGESWKAVQMGPVQGPVHPMAERLRRVNERYVRMAKRALEAVVAEIREKVDVSPRGGYLPHLWEADHIVPVKDGGGCCGLENYRTLCRKCHWKRARKQKR